MVSKSKIDQIRKEIQKNKKKDRMVMDNEPQKSGDPEKFINTKDKTEKSSGKGNK